MKLYRAIAIAILFILISQPFISAKKVESIKLPSPKRIEMPLEKAIFRRCSVRVLSDEEISIEDLSTVLWAAYGCTDKGRTVLSFNSTLAAKVYVLMKDGVYIYDPFNHSLKLYKEGDYRNVSQYKAPVQIGITWDKTKGNEQQCSAQIGAIGQNIYLAANSLGLGTVTTVGSSLASIGLPENEVPKIIMPLGHLKYPYRFVYLPLLISNIPRVRCSGSSLTEVLEKIEGVPDLTGNLTDQEMAQVIWSTYGYSYYLDLTKDEFRYHLYRHRTVPSAHAYYPLRIYAITENGIYRYIPNIYDPIYGKLPLAFTPIPMPIFSFLVKVKNGDFREKISEAVYGAISSSPLIIISVLDLERTRPKGYDDFSGMEYRWLWYYEAGAAVHNALLEAIALNLSANVYPLKDKDLLLDALGLDKERFDPLLAIAVGETSTS